MLEQDIHALSLSSLASVLFPSETRGLVSGGKLSRRLALTFLHFKTVERIGIYASLTIYSRQFTTACTRSGLLTGPAQRNTLRAAGTISLNGQGADKHSFQLRSKPDSDGATRSRREARAAVVLLAEEAGRCRDGGDTQNAAARI